MQSLELLGSAQMFNRYQHRTRILNEGDSPKKKEVEKRRKKKNGHDLFQNKIINMNTFCG